MRFLLPVLLLSAPLAACGADARGTCGPEYVAGEADFQCVHRWPKVRTFRVVNRCGQQDLAEQLLRQSPEGMQLPVGTIVQVLPTEALVKRGGGFDPQHGDWEYFELAATPTGTKVVMRGREQPFNVAGRCRDCHDHAANHDYICGAAQQCPPPFLHNGMLEWTQLLDPRCRP